VGCWYCCGCAGGADYDSDDDFRGGGGKSGKGGGKKGKGGGKAGKAAEKGGAVKGKGGKADKAGAGQDSKAGKAGPHAGAPSAAAMEAAVVRLCSSMEGQVGGGDGDETGLAALVKLLRPAV